MRSRVYQINIHSQLRFLVALIGTFPLSVFFIKMILPKFESDIFIFLLILVAFIISFYLSYHLGLGKAKIVFDEEGLHHILEHRFIFSSEKNHLIPWNTIDSYTFQEDRTFDSFIINLIDNRRYKIDKMNILPIKDDFNQLVKDFPKLSNDYKNRSSDSETKLIKEGKSIYASKMFNLFLYFLSIGFLVLFLNKMFYPKSSISWASLSLIGSFVFYYWIMKSKKKQNESRLILLISINELVFCRLGCACFV